MPKGTKNKRTYTKSGKWTGVTINLRTERSKPIGARLDAFVAAQRVPPAIADVALLALDEFLKREGF